jgi:gentisate 1,2-dioxygenase
MDGLDIPLVRDLDTSFFEPSGDRILPPEKPMGDSETRYASGHLRPAWERPDLSGSPLFVYEWERTKEALCRLATVDASPIDDVVMEFTNPTTGGPVLATMSCQI